jgi:hypothetical protein
MQWLNWEHLRGQWECRRRGSPLRPFAVRVRDFVVAGTPARRLCRPKPSTPGNHGALRPDGTPVTIACSPATSYRHQK